MQKKVSGKNQILISKKYLKFNKTKYKAFLEYYNIIGLISYSINFNRSKNALYESIFHKKN